MRTVPNVFHYQLYPELSSMNCNKELGYAYQNSITTWGHQYDDMKESKLIWWK